MRLNKKTIPLVGGCVLLVIVFGTSQFLWGKYSHVPKWYELPLQFENYRHLSFRYKNVDYRIRSIEVYPVRELERVWGGSPKKEGAFIAVSLESGGRVMPLGGKAASFLNLNYVEEGAEGLIMRGSDGGTTWTAKVDLVQRESDQVVRLQVLDVRDERTFWMYRP